MQCDAELDVQVQLAWAVRKELDILISQLQGKEDRLSGTADLEEVRRNARAQPTDMTRRGLN